jgi:hypothetical protein
MSMKYIRDCSCLKLLVAGEREREREREREVSKAKSWGSCGKAKALLCISFFLCCMFHSSSGRVSAADATLGIIAYYYEHNSFSRFFLLVCEGFSTFAGF